MHGLKLHFFYFEVSFMYIWTQCVHQQHMCVIIGCCLNNKQVVRLVTSQDDLPYLTHQKWLKWLKKERLMPNAGFKKNGLLSIYLLKLEVKLCV